MTLLFAQSVMGLTNAGILASGSFSISQVASQLGVQGADTAERLLGLRAEVGQLLARDEIQSALPTEQRAPLAAFAAGQEVESEVLSTPFRELLRIKNEFDPAPAADDAVQEQAVAMVRAVPRGQLGQQLFGAPVNAGSNLVQRPLQQLMANARIVTPLPDGRIDVHIPSHGSYTSQDLFDFYCLIFHQAQIFREYLSALRDQGADINRLEFYVQQLDTRLQGALRLLNNNNARGAWAYLYTADKWMRQFQQGIIDVAREVGFRIDPQRGRIQRMRNMPPPAQLFQPVADAEPVIAPQRIIDVQGPPPAAVTPEIVHDVSADVQIPRRYLIVYGSGLDHSLDFREHDRYYVYQDPSPYSQDRINIFSRRVNSQSGFYGVLYQEGEQLIFENRLGLKQVVTSGIHPGSLQVDRGSRQVRRLRQSTPSSPSISVLRRSGVWNYHEDRRSLQFAVHPIKVGIMALVEAQLRAQGPLSAEMLSLIKELYQQEESEVMRNKRGRLHQWCMAFVNEDGPPHGSGNYKGVAEKFGSEEVLALIRAMMAALPQSRFYGTWSRGMRIIKALLPRASNKAQMALVPVLVRAYLRPMELSGSDIDGEPVYAYLEEQRFGNLTSGLEKMLSGLGISGRLVGLRTIAREMQGQEEVSQLWLTMLSNVAGSLPPDALVRERERTDSAELRMFLQAYEHGFPMLAPLYNMYLADPNPQGFMIDTSRQVNYFRRGGTLYSRNVERHLAYAYAGLDNPEQLDLDKFVREIEVVDLPTPFLNESFTVRVPRVQVSHADIDKGILREAYEAVARVYTVDRLSDYLQEVLASLRQHGLRKLRQNIEAVLSRYQTGAQTSENRGDVVTSQNVVSIAGEIMQLLAEQKKLNNQSREVLANLTIGTAATDEDSAHLIATLSTYHDKVAPQQLVDILNALREFYGDSVGTVLSALQPEPRIGFITKMRKRLQQQADRIKTQSADMMAIECVPSKSQADAFAGYVGEDCSKGRWKQEIKRKDTQVYRMIHNNRLVGVLYLKRDTLDGKVVLNLGIEPRSRFRVDHKALLKGVTDQFIAMMEQYDYDYILISVNSHERSNRPDMNKAIDEQFTRRVHFNQAISGKIFSGHDFLVVWKRPPDLNKGRPPHIDDAISMSARTMPLSGDMPIEAIPPALRPSDDESD